MTDTDFLREIIADLGNDGPRLVFADWLDERGDPRAGEQRLTVALRAVLASPEDDAPRLAYAAIAEQYGDRARGEFIRVQCELAEFTNPSPMLPHNQQRLAYLRRRVDELLTRYGNRWVPKPLRVAEYVWNGPVYQERNRDGLTVPQILQRRSVEFRRGFVASVTLSAEAWLGGLCSCPDFNAPGSYAPTRQCKACKGTGRTPGHADAFLVAAPLEVVRLTTMPEAVCEVVNNVARFSLAGVGDRYTHPELICQPGTFNSIPGRRVYVVALLEKRWLRIRFELPPTSVSVESVEYTDQYGMSPVDYIVR